MPGLSPVCQPTDWRRGFGCTAPEKVRLTEFASLIEISVIGQRASEPCTMQHVTLIDYVQIGSIGRRQVTGNGS